MTMPSVRRFGDIPGVPIGTLFPNRAALAAAGVHRPRMAGISGGAAEGADSIVLNGGYEDDQDRGDEVVYTGHGGNDPETGRQVADQTLTVGNKALAKNCLDGLPVRVVRGWREPSGFGPPTGFRYDGLYHVERYWSETGRSGFKIWRFLLLRDDPRPAAWAGDIQEPDAMPAERIETTIQRIVRNSSVVQHVKELHDFRCQVCGIRLETPGGPYAEGAHVRPLGRPHNGSDDPTNILCLCPNDQVLLDTGAIVVRDDLVVVERGSGRQIGRLLVTRGHSVSQAQVAYHRALFIR
jgi:putative restriction endonuclease